MPSCQCEACVRCCKGQPGWFAPGEAEKAAEWLGLPFDVFKRFLIVDYWAGKEQVSVWAPRKARTERDRSIASWSYAFTEDTCIFLGDGLCLIHPVKPLECKRTMGCSDKPSIQRQTIMKKWKKAGNPLERQNDQETL